MVFKIVISSYPSIHIAQPPNHSTTLTLHGKPLLNMSDKSTFQSGRYTQESGDNGSVSRAPSTSAGSGTRTQGSSTEMDEDGDETVFTGSYREDEIEVGKITRQVRLTSQKTQTLLVYRMKLIHFLSHSLWLFLIQQRIAFQRASLAHFDKQDTKEQDATYAALAAAQTREERGKIYRGPMFRPPPPTPAQLAERAQQTERDRLVMLFMSGQTEEAVAMCKKDENGLYINPWEKKSGPSQ
jgi:hypothetical protein